MTAGWTARRFWQEARAEAVDGGFTVLLDSKPVRTPARAGLVLPTRPMAEAIADEWRAQGSKVDPQSMPMARFAHSAIDKVMPQFAEVADLVAAYGGSDLLCYRAADPAVLVARQAAAWDPLLDWAAHDLGAPLTVTTGVMPIDQPAESLARLTRLVTGATAFELAALHDLVAITGSLVLGLAVTRALLPVESAWDASRIDEVWQAEVWGSDETAEQAEAVRHLALRQATRFFALCR